MTDTDTVERVAKAIFVKDFPSGNVKGRWDEVSEPMRDDYRACARAAIAALPPAVPELARHQPCGCIVCRCESDEQCSGCGAKNCGTHAVGEIPNPVYVTTPDPVSEAAKVGKLVLAATRAFHWIEGMEGKGNSQVSVDLRAALRAITKDGEDG